MKKAIILCKTLFLAIYLSILSSNTILANHEQLSAETLTLLKAVTGINFIFRNFSYEIWPGYDLSSNPYIAYLPNQFVLFLNAQEPPAGFEPYPSDWPDLGTKAFIHHGTYRDLVGQYAFDFRVDSINTFAMGIPNNLLFSSENPTFLLLGSTIHEAFHQYQHDHFGNIPWAREEQYPILDIENTALSSLEMHILEHALKAMFSGDNSEMEEALKQFVAVRDYRWKYSDDFVKKYEQGQEINEGTARYVEMKALECLLKLDANTTNNKLLKAIKKDIRNISIEELLIDDMESRLSGLAVAPEDMLRNRIYPIGASLGFLLDRLKIDWKKKFELAGPNISFSGLLAAFFDLDSLQLPEYRAKAKSIYHYEEIYSTAGSLINEYLTDYQNALETFYGQQGTRIEINLPSSGIKRFRSSRDRKWIVGGGRITLCLNYNLYSLKSLRGDGLFLEIHDSALLDEDNREEGRKKVVFYTSHLSSLYIDDASFAPTTNSENRFKKIRIEGENFSFEAEMEGKFSLRNDRIVINLK